MRELCTTQDATSEPSSPTDHLVCTRGFTVRARRCRRHCWKNAEYEQSLRDTFQFLAGVGIVLNIAPHLSVAARSAVDVGGWADCAALVAQATTSTCYVHAGLGSRNDVVFADRISKHVLCDGLVGDVGIPTHLLVAAVFQFAEYEQMFTTTVRMKNIDLNFKDPEPEAEELTKNALWRTS